MSTLTPRQIVAELDKFVIDRNRPNAWWPWLCATVGGGSTWIGAAGRGFAQKHHHDGPHGRGQDGNSPAAGQTFPAALCQGGGHQVHGSGLCGPGCGIHGARPYGNRHQPGARGRKRPRAQGCRSRGRVSPYGSAVAQLLRDDRARGHAGEAPAAVPPGLSGPARSGIGCDRTGRPGRGRFLPSPAWSRWAARCATCSARLFRPSAAAAK